MFSYSKVLNPVKSLTLADQLRLLEDLKKMIQLREEVAEDDEVTSAEEIAEGEAAWQDYQAGRGDILRRTQTEAIWRKKLTYYILLKAAERYLSRMQPDDQVRIVKALDTLVSDYIA